MPKLTVFCDISAAEHHESTPDLIYAQSPLSCLSLAETRSPDCIFIRSGFGSMEKNAKLIELCSCLKKDAATRAIPIVVLLEYPLKELSSVLQQYQVDYIRFVNGDPVTPDYIAQCYRSLESLSGPAAFTESVCPHINYELFNKDDEITLCRADLNRLVINRKRLREYCSGSNHRNCPYFLKPRIESSRR